MYNLLNHGHYHSLRKAFNNAKKEILLISPFIGSSTSKMLSKLLSTTGITCKVITRFNRDDFINNASSIEGLKILINSGAEIYALRDLHSKLYLVDDDFGLIGSANFTFGGFSKNHELQIMISDEPEMLQELRSYYNLLLSKIQSSDEGMVSVDIIEKELEEVERLKKKKKNDEKKGVSTKNNKKYGADISIQEEATEDIVERAISSNMASIKNDTWLKFEGSSNDRLDSSKKHHLIRNNISKSKITSFPQNPSGMNNGDYIYLTAVSYNQEGNPSSIILGRARTKGYNSRNIADSLLQSEYKWMEHYKYFVELYDVELVDAPIKNCISMTEMIDDLGKDTYPSTASGKNIDMYKVHLQKSHLRITNKAKNYLDERLEELFTKYGVIK